MLSTMAIIPKKLKAEVAVVQMEVVVVQMEVVVVQMEVVAAQVALKAEMEVVPMVLMVVEEEGAGDRGGDGGDKDRSKNPLFLIVFHHRLSHIQFV
ncbi:MAG: hypothetical protein A2167_06570 [Planctomycetes bacterium RBG_13_46_10]|nr:MAG: hypothetical protein A2167_06570 [Planctomycetes bacterium RBG_13_46_10]